MDRRYQVFLSSTYEDLKEERLEVMKALLELDCIPAGMEYFPAGNEEAWSYVTDLIDSCDYYVVVVAGRYGSTDEAGRSFTEREYEYAVEQGIPVAAFLHADPESIPVGKTEPEADARSRLDDFRDLCRERLCKDWRTPHELGAVVSRSLTQLIRRNPRPGWVRADSLASEEATRQILELKETISRQAEELDQLVSSSMPHVDELAQGTDTFDLEIKVTLSKDGAGYRSEDRLRRILYSVSPTWDELFSYVAPRMTEPTHEGKIIAALARGLKESVIARLRSEHDAYSIKTVTVPSSTFDTIMLQFTALGLTEVSIGSIEKKHGTKEIRQWKLTANGQRYLFRRMAIRRTVPDGNVDDSS